MEENRFQLGNGLELRVEPSFDLKWSLDKEVETLKKVQANYSPYISFDVSLYNKDHLCLPSIDPFLRIAKNQGLKVSGDIEPQETFQHTMPIVRDLYKRILRYSQRRLQATKDKEFLRKQTAEINIVYEIPDYHLIQDLDLSLNPEAQIRIQNKMNDEKDVVFQLSEKNQDLGLVESLWQRGYDKSLIHLDDLPYALSVYYIDKIKTTGFREFQRKVLSTPLSPRENSGLVLASEATMMSLNGGYRIRAVNVPRRILIRKNPHA